MPTEWPIQSRARRIVVAGHLCLDLTPGLSAKKLPADGGLVHAGTMGVSSGGAVPNVGLALMKLGESVRMVAAIGDDPLAGLLAAALLPAGDQPSLRFIAGAPTSYSIVIAQTEADRFFIHCLGANEVFTSSSVSDEDLAFGEWLHFGYPPLMPAMCESDGEELAQLFSRASLRGLQTSLDFCSIDSTANTSVNWANLFAKCGPNVMLFAPGIDEIRVALGHSVPCHDDLTVLSQISDRLLSYGFAVVALKLGSRGLYLRSSGDRNRTRMWNLSDNWIGRELYIGCFRADLINTNGAGDCSIAGLITALSRGFTPEQSIIFAAAVGACSVEAADASSGVLDARTTISRVQNQWPQADSHPPTPDWHYDDAVHLWRGPFDREDSIDRMKVKND